MVNGTKSMKLKGFGAKGRDLYQRRNIRKTFLSLSIVYTSWIGSCHGPYSVPDNQVDNDNETPIPSTLSRTTSTPYLVKYTVRITVSECSALLQWYLLYWTVFPTSENKIKWFFLLLCDFSLTSPLSVIMGRNLAIMFRGKGPKPLLWGDPSIII